MAEDFYIVSNALIMRQVAESYNFPINRKGFMKCPFHGNGVERTPSLKIYEGTKGFHCKACGVGGDSIRFVSLLNDITDQEAMIELAIRFNIPISTDQEISQEVAEKAKRAQTEYELRIALEQKKNRKLRHLGNEIHVYEKLIRESTPFSEEWCYCQNKLPKLKGEWEILFQELRK